MRTPPLLLLLLLPLLHSSSRYSRSGPRRTQAWLKSLTDKLDKERNMMISEENSQNPAFNRIHKILNFLSSNSLKNGGVKDIPPRVPSVKALLHFKGNQDLVQSLANHLPSSLLQKQEPCIPQRIDNLPGWMLWALHQAMTKKNERRSLAGAKRLCKQPIKVLEKTPQDRHGRGPKRGATVDQREEKHYFLRSY